MAERGDERSATRESQHLKGREAYPGRYLYSDIPFNWHAQYIFDVDHQLPVARLSDLIDRLGTIGWPMSAIGNLALLPVEFNQAKGMMTSDEYLNQLDNAARQIQEPIFEYVALMPPKQLAIPKDGNGDDDLSREEFVEMVRGRQMNIRDKLLSLLGV